MSTPAAFDHALYFDEVASARVISEPDVGSALERIRETESTPPAWYILARSASRADEVLTDGRILAPIERVRLLSVLFAAASAALTAIWALRILRNRLLAAFAGLLVALGSVPAAYAEQLRAYALVTLLAVVYGLLLVRVALRPGLASVCGLVLVTWVGTMTHYFFFFTVGAGLLWVWTSRPPPHGRRRATLALAVGTAGFLPWSTGFLEQHEAGRYRWIAGFSASDVATLPGSLFFAPDGLFYGLARVAATLALAAGAIVVWKTSRGSAVVVLGLVPVAGAALVWALGEPIFNERNLLVVAPYMAIMVAASLKWLPGRSRSLVGGVGIAATVVGAAYAQMTLGRVQYDSVAYALVDVGWTADEPLVIDWHGLGRGAGISLASPVSWYLPDRRRLVRVRDRHECRSRFAVIRVRDSGEWRSRYERHVAAMREEAFYDHLISGREEGRIVIARFTAPIDVPGELFHVDDRRPACLDRRG